MPFYYNSHDKPAPNAFVKFARKIYNPLGFQRGYNFPLWIIFGIGALAFCASRAEFFNYDGVYGPAHVVPGDWEFQRKGLDRWAMQLHLYTVIPIGFLIPWQFLPVVRHKAMLFHRINGYILLLLLIGANIGGTVVAPRALGGFLDAQMAIGLLNIVTLGSALLAYINIKRLQIDQHRAWMLRTWAYAFIIVTQRLIWLPAQDIMSHWSSFHVPMRCGSIDFIFESVIKQNVSALLYKACEDGPNAMASVLANKFPDATPQGIPRLEQIGAVYQLTFGMSILLAMFIHAFAVETYLHLTPAEANRLKRVSRERQLAKGWNHAGDASYLTPQMLGDTEKFDYRADGVKPYKTVDDDSELSELNPDLSEQEPQPYISPSSQAHLRYSSPDGGERVPMRYGNLSPPTTTDGREPMRHR